MVSGEFAAGREQAMFENFAWYRSRTRNAKTIVWCATGHARKAVGTGEPVTLGAYVRRESGDKSAVIGFSALGGSRGRPGGQSIVIPRAASNSLETRLFENFSGPLRYANERALQDLGVTTGRARSYSQTLSLRWDEWLDGIVVFRDERMPAYIRPIAPRQMKKTPSD